MLQYLFFPEKFMLMNIALSSSLLNIGLGIVFGWGITLMTDNENGFKKMWTILFIVWIILQIVSMLGFSGTVSLWFSVTGILFSHLPKLTVALISSIPIWIIKQRKAS